MVVKMVRCGMWWVPPRTVRLLMHGDKEAKAHREQKYRKIMLCVCRVTRVKAAHQTTNKNDGKHAEVLLLTRAVTRDKIKVGVVER